MKKKTSDFKKRMIVENPEEYVFVRFEKSHLKHKKYDAVLRKKRTKSVFKIIPFGQVGYSQYKDKTGLGIYSNVDHNNKERRRLYKLRHRGENERKFSSGYFSWKYLW